MVAKHSLDCLEIDEFDEINGDHQFVSIWCRAHEKYEWHSAPRALIHSDAIIETNLDPVF